MPADYPISLPYTGWKRHLILGTGRAVVSMFPEKASKFKAGELPVTPTRWERLLLAGLVDTHLRVGRLDELTALHDWVWAGDLAVDFHSRAEARFQDVFLAHHSDIVPALRDAMTNTGGGYETVCEIGCGSGLVLQHLSRQLSDPDRFIGLDLSQRQVDINRTRFRDSRMEFETGEGMTWMLRNGRRGSLFFTYGGVFEYFPQLRLQALLSWMVGALRPALLGIVEPLADAHDVDDDARSVPYGAENTFSHPYPLLITQAGLRILWRRECRVGAQRWLMLVAHVPGRSAP